MILVFKIKIILSLLTLGTSIYPSLHLPPWWSKEWWMEWYSDEWSNGATDGHLTWHMDGAIQQRMEWWSNRLSDGWSDGSMDGARERAWQVWCVLFLLNGIILLCSARVTQRYWGIEAARFRHTVWVTSPQRAFKLAPGTVETVFGYIYNYFLYE